MKDKVDAIMDLRAVAEEHGRVVEALANDHSRGASAALLDVRERLEEATYEAIESCHHCGEAHPTAGHPVATVTDIASRFPRSPSAP